MKKYKAVVGPQVLNVEKRNGIQSAFDDFSNIINKETEGGWSYHSMETITVNKKGGCLQKDSILNYQMLIFERDE